MHAVVFPYEDQRIGPLVQTESRGGMCYHMDPPCRLDMHFNFSWFLLQHAISCRTVFFFTCDIRETREERGEIRILICKQSKLVVLIAQFFFYSAKMHIE